MLMMAGMESFARTLVGGPSGPLRARMKQMQREGFPFGVNTQKLGRVRATYDLDAIMLVGVCLALVEQGLSVTRAMTIVLEGLFAIRESYGDVGGESLSFPDQAPMIRRWLLIEQFVVKGAAHARVEALHGRQLSDLGKSPLGMVVISMGHVWEAMASTVEDTAEIQRQLQIVRRVVLGAMEEADGDMSALLEVTK